MNSLAGPAADDCRPVSASRRTARYAARYRDAMIRSSTGALGRLESGSANKRTKAAFCAKTRPSASVTTTGCGELAVQAYCGPSRCASDPGCRRRNFAGGFKRYARSIYLSSRHCHRPSGRFRQAHQLPIDIRSPRHCRREIVAGVTPRASRTRIAGESRGWSACISPRIAEVWRPAPTRRS